MKPKKFIPVLTLLVIAVFFTSFLFGGKLPIPADTIVGLYHPFRDLYAKQYPRGIPYKNSLITDPVRQQYPWKNLAITMVKKVEIPLWNPYSFSGIPLLANMQAGVFYPLNILFLLSPFYFSWGLFIFLQSLLAGLFLYSYLRNLRISKYACLLGTVTFAFSGFSIAWLEWGNILHTALWLPLILLAIDKLTANAQKEKSSGLGVILWNITLLFSLVSSFFAGHLQTFFYLYALVLIYFLLRWWQHGRSKKTLFQFLVLNFLFLGLTIVQWFPTLQFILHSARDVDQANWQKEGWFIPWQNSIQFIVPDFFGNPATLNYWGIWNYAEFIGYIGIVPLIMSVAAIIGRHDKKTWFFLLVFIFSLLLAFPTPLAKLPFMLRVPFLSTAQPTRLLFLIDFSLAVLAAFGFDYVIKQKKGVRIPLVIIGSFFLISWGLILFAGKISWFSNMENISVAKHNAIFPTVIFLISLLVLGAFQIRKNQLIERIVVCLVIVIALIDLFRFGDKFTPFTSRQYLFPSTPTLSFLQRNTGVNRIMTTDSRIFPPNFSSMYHIQSVDGYDPLYLKTYGEYIIALERKKPDISAPFGFDRIVTPKNYESPLVDLLGVKFILSLSDINSPKLKKVFQEGETRVYENSLALPRAFFVKDMKWVNNNHEAIQALFDENFNARQTAVVVRPKDFNNYPPVNTFFQGQAKIVSYEENQITIQTDNSHGGFLVLTDMFYPTWHIKEATSSIQRSKIKDVTYQSDFAFRGFYVPQGKHTLVLYNSLF